MAIPNILNVLTIAVLFFMIFMVMGVVYFKGLLHDCYTDNFSSLRNIDKMPFVTKWDCLNVGGDWIGLESSYDGIFESFKAAFIIS